MENRLWVLGASDPEMQAIEALLAQHGEQVAYAAVRDDGVLRRVTPGEAYLATHRMGGPTVTRGMRVFAVECASGAGYAPGDNGPMVVVDHHRPTDPGYDSAPAEYWRGSSLGQVCDLLGKDPTDHLRMVAAADHCPRAAYAGECPGVAPAALAAWRVETRAAFQGRPVSDVEADITAATAALGDAPRVSGVADLRGAGRVPELPEAAMRAGRAYLAAVTDRDGREKTVLGCASPEQVAAFLVGDLIGPIEGGYGVPTRGYAGGYASEECRHLWGPPRVVDGIVHRECCDCGEISSQPELVAP